MEAAVVTAFLSRIAPKLFVFLQQNTKMQLELKHDIQYIKIEFVMIDAAIQDHDRRSGSYGVSNVQRAWIQVVRELAHEIEDCIDRFVHRVTPDPDASSFRPASHGLKTMPARTKFAAAIKELRKRLQEASKLKECYSGGGGQSSNSEPRVSASTSDDDTHTLEADLVGMDVPRDELLELTRETQGQPQLKVISVVGFGGLGKTLLAREVYSSIAVGSEYEPRVWVRAADKGVGDVLKEILQKLGMQVHDGNCHVNKLSTSLREHLASKRFFVVIDDMRTEYWNIIKNAFPADTGVSSRVIVTTAIHSIANACSSANGHVYVMTTLDEEHSRKLFFRAASLEDPPDDTELGSEALKKCDGLPLALVTTAQFLQSRGNPARTEWAKLCDKLGEHLETNDTLARMNRLLVHSYTSLPDKVLKACLLYLGIFPCRRPVRRGSLIRRWLAEGFVEKAGDAADKFKELVNRSIIQPVDVSHNAEVKTCQTHGMMLEFILQKSMCESFITLSHDQARPPGKIRWLSLHHNRETPTPNMDWSIVRSLTIFGKAHKSVLEFSKYELLRVLDLEECDDQLEDKHLREICNLLLLRYLSLGGAVTVLPKEIARLKLLETLDVRRTKIKILPIQVIKLASLIHLFGEFKLEDVGRRMSKLQSFLSEKSKLETLAGFVADNSQGFPQLMDHMKHLTEVKIRCESTADASNNTTHLSKAVEGFIQRGTNVNEARSLSLNFKEWSEELLNFSLEDSCYLSSLKLQGNPRRLPRFVTMLAGLTELCLSSGDHLSGDVLASLSSVRSLNYLKLIAGRLGRFVIKQGALESLRRLCIVVQFVDPLVIKEGALPRLESLRLISNRKDQRGFCGIRIERHGRLKEVALHEGLSDEKKDEWKEAAKKHPKRPKVLFVRTEEVDQMQMGSETRGSSEGHAESASVADVQTEVNEGPEHSVLRTVARLQPTCPVLGGRRMTHHAISVLDSENRNH